jgi:hypothetical protein
MRRRGGQEFSRKSSNRSRYTYEKVLRSQDNPLQYWPNPAFEGKLRYVRRCRKSLEPISRYRQYGNLFTNKANFIIQIPGMKSRNIQRGTIVYWKLLYWHLWFVRSTIFFYISWKTARISWWILLRTLCVYIFSTTFLNLRSTDLYMITDMHMNSCKVPDILVSLKKISSIKFHENPSSKTWIFPRGRADMS